MLVQSGTIYVGNSGGLRFIVAYQPSPTEGVSVAYLSLGGGIIQRHGVAFDLDGCGDHGHWTDDDQYNWQIAERNVNIAYVQSLTDEDIFRLMSMAGGEA